MNQYIGKRVGYTLIELMVTMAIVVIVIGLTIPRFFVFDELILVNELEKLYSVMLLLQQSAIATNKPFELTFSSTSQQYSYLHAAHIVSYSLPKQIGFGVLAHSYGPPGDPHSLITSPITFHTQEKKDVATLYPDGKIAPGSVYFIDRQHKHMRALTCSVGNVSHIRKYKYMHGRWQEVSP